ncbi:MAG: hypothetical protein HeimC2_40250 [Candidatus Heimdallarchaeota archaeon LC_2]|nr:MAG: hypothetical protein HeimC2_40250 [Candidatus Heimdallarchaeota archaeon LC_2]
MEESFELKTNNLTDNAKSLLHFMQKTYGNDVSDIYLGAYWVLRQETNPEKFFQAAHSFRELTNVILRKEFQIIIEQDNKQSSNNDNKQYEKISQAFLSKPHLIPLPSRTENENYIRNWLKSHKYFVKISHHSQTIDEINEDEFYQQVDNLETYLHRFLKPFITRLLEIDIFTKISQPSDEDANRLISNFTHFSNVKYFFENIDIELRLKWFKPLYNAHFFEIKHEEDEINWGLNPGFYYLPEFAKQYPSELFEIIEKNSKTRNQNLVRVFISVLEAFDENTIVSLVPTISSWIKSLSNNQSSLPHKLIQFTNLQLREERISLCLKLVKELIRINQTENRPKYSDETYISEYYYQEILNNIIPQIFKKSPVETFELLCFTLKDYESCTNSLSSDWRPSIEDTNQIFPFFNAGSSLVEIIRDLLIDYKKDEKELLNVLIIKLENFAQQAQESNIYLRIELFILSQTLELNKGKLIEILRNIDLFSIELHHEIFNVLKLIFPKLNKEIKEEFLVRIDKSTNFPRISLKQNLIVTLKRRFPKLFKTQNENRITYTNKDRKVWSEIAVYRLWHAIKNELDDKRKSKWTNFQNRFGDLDHPDFHSYHTGGYGSTSPYTYQELETLSVEEILQLYITWEPNDKQSFDLIDKEGFSNILVEHIWNNRDRYDDFFDTIIENIELSKVYLESHENVLRGKSDEKLTENDLIKLYTIIDRHFENETPEDREFINTTLRIFETSFEILTEANPIELINKNIAILLKISKIETPNISGNEETFLVSKLYSHGILNIPKLISIQVLIDYLLWINEKKLSNIYDEAIKKIHMRFEDLLNIEIDKSLLVRYLFGWYSVSLHYWDKDWFLTQFTLIFPLSSNLRKYCDMSWIGYIERNDVRKDIFEKFSNLYDRAISRMESHNFTELSIKNLGIHLVKLYVYNEIDLTDNSLLVKYYKKSNCEALSQILWFLGKNLNGFHQNNSANTKRISSLLEWRINTIVNGDNSFNCQNYTIEFGAFSLWIENGIGILDDNWLLDILIQLNEIRISTNHFFLDTKILHFLENQLLHNEEKAFQCLFLLVQNTDSIIYDHQKIADFLEKLNFNLLSNVSQSYIEKIIEIAIKNGVNSLNRFILQ